MFGSFQQALKGGDLRNKLLFTLGMLLVFRLGAHIPVPGINADVFAKLLTNQLFGFYDIISGGAFKRFSIFAMSITPYINASIIMQLLTVVIPKLEQLQKEGEEGRKKITQYVRYGTVILGFIQAIGMAIAMGRYPGVLHKPGIGAYLIIAISLTAGTALLMWIGEMITEKGIGNGISLIIFAGIVARIPSGLNTMVELLKAGTIGFFNILSFVVIALVIISALVAVNEGQRRIPIQYAKRVVGRRVYGGQSTFLPLRVNMGGVIPIIFGMSIMMFPATIASWFPKSGVSTFINTYFHFGTVLYNILYALLIFFFTYFYVAIIFNPADVADNIKKYGGFIPGIRPGRPTADYIDRVLSRLTFAGGIFLAFIAILPNFVIKVTGITSLYFGGTALLIVVGVALDTMKQLEAHLLLRSYEGFVK
ncbi:MAG TPA: preprotein translocase subunit SecY [Syntrophothermus lipocalidus]|uniref:Protein translocase subunit SecY n=1 Tax=Syntrophothermus lipocalidus (strain DSM 12680 / TGB-C1) TaxID=643648 RepID=D7CJK3_SYNLT|nr:preprotein translocase subunit SecY [Syntrophothermus lipocalidus]ADI02958.1 preprotein translocase, SecY subunit [Syntrophothermus lipocalidus DSM 12680]HHV77845.1 preprotein translocase subunit SecY [Syntrophothermus lipocalidus]HOV42471.1 preprotein translocase subunit SecY [Syntrophothermus lipocalidus]